MILAGQPMNDDKTSFNLWSYKLLRPANYEKHEKIATSHLCRTSVLNDILHAPLEERLFSGSKDGLGKKMLLTLEQK